MQHYGLGGTQLFKEPVSEIDVVENDPFHITCAASKVAYSTVIFLPNSESVVFTWYLILFCLFVFNGYP